MSKRPLRGMTWPATAGLAAAAFLLLAACSSTSSGVRAGASTTSSRAATADSTSVPPAASPVVGQASNSRLGPILVDAMGMTLYRNTQEKHGTFACTGSCTSAWPPLLAPAGVSSPPSGTGVAGVLATVTRPDGVTQITYNGSPLYHFAGDHQPGDANGQGAGGVWFVVSPSATASTTSPTAGSAPPVTAKAATPATTPVATTAPTSPRTTPPTSPPTTSKPPPTTPPTTSKPPPTSPPTTHMCAYPPCY